MRPLRTYYLSRVAPSTTRPPLQLLQHKLASEEAVAVDRYPDSTTSAKLFKAVAEAVAALCSSTLVKHQERPTSVLAVDRYPDSTPSATPLRGRRSGCRPVSFCRTTFGCGGKIRTCDLRIMSPTSYQAAPPRDRGVPHCYQQLAHGRFANQVCGFTVSFPGSFTTAPILRVPAHTRLPALLLSDSKDSPKGGRVRPVSRLNRRLRLIAQRRTSRGAVLNFGSASGFGCGGRIRTYDLRVMSPTSYQTAPPRHNLY